MTTAVPFRPCARFAASVSLLVALFCAWGCSTPTDEGDASSVSDAKKADVTVQVELPGAGTEALAAFVCPGGHGCACTSDADCSVSGLCVTDASGAKVCSTPCPSGSCPDGLTCKAVSTAKKPGGWCVAKRGFLCDPCTKSSDCRALGHADAACVHYGALGRFCGVQCQGDSDCGAGFACKASQSVDVGIVQQCVKVDGGALGTCGCSPRATADKLETVCGTATCAGKRSCGEVGLSACDATATTAESCNGVDDDCDGLTDEGANGQGLCNDSNPCTSDTCDLAKGCQHAPTSQPCNADGSLCTANDKCEGGKCQPGAALVCDDGNACTDDTCVAATGCVVTLGDGKGCDDGNTCTEADKCSLGKCAGKAKACDDKNPCTQDVCLAGACTGTVVDGAPCSDGDGCTGGDTCAGGACKGAVSDCNDGNPCTADSCDKAKGCASLPVDPTVCDDGNLCTTGEKCAAGTCSGGSAVVCSNDNPCTVQACAASTGLCGAKLKGDGSPCSDGKACTASDTCSKGWCAGKEQCDDANPCTQDACDAAGKCAHTGSGSAACDDGDKCTTNDKCAGGKCQGAAVLSLCDDSNSCTTDVCDAQTGCSHSNQSDGASCDDGLACSGTDSCKVGACSQHSQACIGCTSDADCASLDDANACNGKVGCAAGQCAVDVKSVVVCDHSKDGPCAASQCDAKSGKCAVADLAEGATCSDGDVCSSGDACTKGSCAASQGCDDANPCTADGCDAKGCTHTATAGVSCSDDSTCTSGDACDGSGACAGKKALCNDDNPCTDDGCDPKTGCTKAANTASCTLADCKQGQCAKSVCEPTGKTGCDDNDPCTTDSCISNACQFAPAVDGTPCPDGDACTTGEACASGKCGTKPVDCPDASTACQLEACDAKTGCGMVSAKDGAVCDDGDACVTGESCTTGKCMGTATVCDDKNPCTADSCNAADGTCLAAPATATCDDGNPCTSSDTCDKGSCGGTAKVCDDGDVCTADACDTKTGSCATPAATDGTVCDDKSACTEGDVCTSGKCAGNIPADAVSTYAGEGTAGFGNGTASQAKFSEPVALAVDATGNVYVCDAASGGARIRLIDTKGSVTTLAGQGLDGFVDGPAATARFWRPSGIAVGGDGNLYVADRFNQRIRKLLLDGTVSTLAGDAADPSFGDPKALGDFADGQGVAAKFDEPAGIAWSAKDSALYVVEAANNRVRKVLLDGTVSTVAGKGPIGSDDGPALGATFKAPTGIAVDSGGAIFIADTGNHRIRKLSGGMVTTVGGSSAGLVNGAPAESKFSSPAGLAAIGALVYVADAQNHAIRQVAFSEVKTLTGTGAAAMVNDVFAKAQFKAPLGVVAVSAGLWYVADAENFLIRKLFSVGAACGGK